MHMHSNLGYSYYKLLFHIFIFALGSDWAIIFLFFFQLGTSAGEKELSVVNLSPVGRDGSQTFVSSRL